jgi:hypothetical protein
MGIPLHYDNLRREDVQPLIDKILQIIVGWRGKFLFYRARLTLIKPAWPVYMFTSYLSLSFLNGLFISSTPRCLIASGMIFRGM